MFNPMTQQLHEVVPTLYADTQWLREHLEKPENIEERNALALALIDEACDLYTIRDRWNEPLMREIIVSWWRYHCALPWKEGIAVTDALKLNKMYAPCWTTWR